MLLGKRRCCGRPIISKGLLDQGRQYARANIDALKPFAAQGIPIIGVEPSCLLTLKEDYLQLLPGEDAELVAGHCITIDEFLAGLVKEGKLPLREDAAAREILLHGHCHQKAGHLGP